MSLSTFYLNQRISTLQSEIDAGGGGGGGNLATVLAAGNSAGINDIYMNSNDILAANNIDLVTINGAAYPPAGGATTLSAVLLTGNSAGTTDINMNSNDILAVSNINTSTINSGAGTLTLPSVVAFTNAVAPTCTANPQNPTELCNKQYVDSQSVLTAYQLYFNRSVPYTVPSGATYSELNDTQVATPTTVAWTTSTTSAVFLGGFFNLLSALNVTTIPAGVFTLLAFANINSIGFQGRIAFYYTIVGTASTGVETTLFTSSSSLLLNTVAPLIGSVSIQGTVPLISLTPYTGIGIKLFLQSNVATLTTGSVVYQTPNAYSSILTSVVPVSSITNLSLVLTAGNTANNSIVLSDGTTSNTMDKTGYTTKNTIDNATHFLDFSDASTTGVGAIQKTAGIQCNPSTKTISLIGTGGSQTILETNQITLTNSSGTSKRITSNATELNVFDAASGGINTMLLSNMGISAANVPNYSAIYSNNGSPVRPFITMAFDPILSNNAIGFQAGSINFIAVQLMKGQTYTGAAFYTQAVSTGKIVLGVYNAAGARLATSAAAGITVGAINLYSINFDSTFNCNDTGIYFCALLLQAGSGTCAVLTSTTTIGINLGPVPATAALGLTKRSFRTSTGYTSNTDLPASISSSTTTIVNLTMPWVGLY